MDALWAIERAFWLELRGVDGLSEPRKRRSALTPQDNRRLAALYTALDLIPSEVAERSWRLHAAPNTVRIKAKSAYTAEKLVAAAAELHKLGKSPVQVSSPLLSCFPLRQGLCG